MITLESKRGCGFRTIGGLYLVGSGLAVPCDRLPFDLHYCPTCGSGIKFTRGAQFIDWHKYAGEHKHLLKKCTCEKWCPVCHPKENEKYGVMWVGKKYYTPQSFTEEAVSMGVCKKIATQLKDVVLGETWILLAHKEARTYTTVNEKGKSKKHGVPGIFYAFKPKAFEMLITMKQANKKKFVKDLIDRGITPVVVLEATEDGKHANKTAGYEEYLELKKEGKL